MILSIGEGKIQTELDKILAKGFIESLAAHNIRHEEVKQGDQQQMLIDLNRAAIVTETDALEMSYQSIHSVKDAEQYLPNNSGKFELKIEKNHVSD